MYVTICSPRWFYTFCICDTIPFQHGHKCCLEHMKSMLGFWWTKGFFFLPHISFYALWKPKLCSCRLILGSRMWHSWHLGNLGLAMLYLLLISKDTCRMQFEWPMNMILYLIYPHTITTFHKRHTTISHERYVFSILPFYLC
jgi:hypothetical protein